MLILGFKLLALCSLHLLAVPVYSAETKTGGVLYDMYVETCCAGKVITTHGDLDYHYCCGEEPINFGEKICCWKTGIAHNLTYGMYTGCCKDKIYDHRTHTCCGRKDLIPNPKTMAPDDFHYFECCGDETFDTRSQICCKRKIFFKWSPYSECCGNEQFDSRSHLCCDKTIRSRHGLNQQAECCGKDVYDTATQLCCENKMIPMGKGVMDCCGSHVYDKQSELCCENKIITRKLRNSFHKCCGALTYDSSKQICCAGKILKRTSFRSSCCRDILYDTDVNICCGGELSKRTSLQTRCCGQHSFDARREICCGGVVMKKNRGTKQWCCSNERKFHDKYVCHEKGGELEKYDEQA